MYFTGNNLSLEDVHIKGCISEGYSSTTGGGGLYASGQTVRLTDCLIENNQFQGSSQSKGGGIFIKSTSYELLDCTIRANQVSSWGSGNSNARASGGGAWLEGSGIIDGCVINGNIASASGDFGPDDPGGATARAGALYFDGEPAGEATISNTTISDNLARTGGTGDRTWEAGAIYSFGGDLTITGSTISRNALVAPELDVHDTKGGAIFVNSSGNLSLTNCVLDSNVARIGSAIYWIGLVTPGIDIGELILERTRITGGQDRIDQFSIHAEFASWLALREVELSGNRGGGVYCLATDSVLYERCLFHGNARGAKIWDPITEVCRIHNSTFSRNVLGGGLELLGGTIDLQHCTFVDDSLGSGQIAGRELIAVGTEMRLRGNLFAETSDHGISAFFDGGFNVIISEGGNVCDDGSLDAWLNHPSDASDTDAGIGVFGDHGGPTHTWSLSPTSTCIDRGGPGDLLTDQRGLARDANADAGAYEFGGLDPSILVAGQTADTLVCAGHDLMLLVSATSAVPLSFQWTHNGVAIPGAQSATLELTASLSDSGSYTCVISNGIQTVESATSEVEVVICAGISASPAAGWRLFPNPTTVADGVNICSESNTADMRIQVLDVHGRPVDGVFINYGQCVHVSLGAVVPGVYAVRVETNGIQRLHRIVVR